MRNLRRVITRPRSRAQGKLSLSSASFVICLLVPPPSSTRVACRRRPARRGRRKPSFARHCTAGRRIESRRDRHCRFGRWRANAGDHECSRKAISSFDGFCARYSKVGDREVFDHRDFPWLPAIEADWRKVRAELDAILPYMAHMQNFHDVSPNYLTYFFYGFGLKAFENCRRCPET